MQPTSRIQYIDAWRFIAIALVLVCHVLAYSHPWYREQFPALVWRLQNLGTFGVQIFFCISGFVICRGLLHEQSTTGAVGIRSFYIRRFFRIIPPLFIYMLAISALSMSRVVDVTPGALIKASLFLCNIGTESCGWFVGHTWSLAYEEQFYLVFPVLFIAFAAPRTRHLIVVLTGLVMLASLLMHAGSFHQTAEYASTFAYMLMGCVAALYWQEWQAVLKRMPVTVWAALLVATPVMSSLIVLPDPLRYLVSVVLAPPAICAVVLGTPVSVPAIGKFFLNPVVSHLGKISFTVYLWQQLATAPYAGSPLYFVFVALAGVFLVAYLSYRYFEQPLMSLGNRYSRTAKLNKLTHSRETAPYSPDVDFSDAEPAPGENRPG
jgi:peptidoglycan/LPS O-acetylase OafA/YrhL